MLQEVDQWPDSLVLLVATNHPELVDQPCCYVSIWLGIDLPDASAIAVAIQRFRDDGLFKSWVDVLAAGLQGAVARTSASITHCVAAMLADAPSEQRIGPALGQRQEALSKAERLNLAIELAKAGQHTHMQISQMTGVCSRHSSQTCGATSPRKGRAQNK